MAIKDLIGDNLSDSVSGVFDNSKSQSKTSFSERLEDNIKKKSLESPMKNYLWKVLLPSLDMRSSDHYKLLTPPRKEYLNKILEHKDLHLDISSRMYGISTPYMSMETEKAMTGNTYWYYAKQNDIGNISLDVYEYEDGATYTYFDTWFKLLNEDSYDSDLDTRFVGYYPPVVYKKKVLMYRLSHSREELVVHEYDGYFVSGISDVSSDYETDGVLKYQITLTGDSVQYHIQNAASVGKKPEEDKLLEEIYSFETLFGDVAASMGDALANEVGNKLKGVNKLLS